MKTYIVTTTETIEKLYRVKGISVKSVRAKFEDMKFSDEDVIDSQYQQMEIIEIEEEK